MTETTSGGIAVSMYTRRSFLAASAAAVATVGVGTTTSSARSAPRRRIRITREDHRVVVIGTGFGGGVAALRLAQAGVDVTVLERGRRWQTGPNSTTFPNATNPDKRILWHGSNPRLFGRTMIFDPYVGLLEAVIGANMTALCAAGVGGGSLVYQGMTLQPDEAVFNANFPQRLDWQRMNRIHYPRVARMLRLSTAPDELIDSAPYRAPRVFARRARAAGLPVAKIPMPIDWNYALAELRGKMAPSYTDGSGALGVNNGGKHSVDVTYIAAAEATGRATVHTLHTVTGIRRGLRNTWIVSVDRTDLTGRVLEHKELTTQAVFLGAGSINTTKLLLRADAHDTIQDLPDKLGQGWGTNADRIYTWTSPDDDFGLVQGGPVVYGSKNWSNPSSAFTVIQASMPPNPIGPKTTMLVGYGVSRRRGHLTFDSRLNDAVLHWPHEGDSVIQNAQIGPTVRKIAGPSGILIDTNGIEPSTWHPLGGASMGTVCDLEGRVYGQRGLYVVDGALMPGNSAACNPSMTIAAVAERALDNIVARDLGTHF
ncbi:GMC oxidoreductase [Gordonia soli]|uniref:Cholesterol oxidase n=1 Tax=Gordonia soli NBRC 108243 TaxID=1223545 RepID=M0QM34_9ACTN|nr:GMC oxidoreductase [Gordonia soli]GAC69474.1 putative oxidoreductase [Gordonia soli NBRC 108243]